MLTKLELNIVSFYVHLASVTCWFPFDFNRKSNHLKLTKSKWKRFGCVCNFLLSLAYLIFLIVRAIPTFGGFTRNSMPFHVFALIHETSLVAFHIQAYLYAEDMAILFNQLVNFNSYQGKFYLCKSVQPGNFREKLFQVLHYSIWGMAVLFFGFFILAPHLTHYPYSLVPENRRSIWVFCLFVPLEAFLPIKIVIAHLFSLDFWYICIVTTNYWVTKVSVDWSNFPGNFNDAMHLYRCIYILNKTYNDSYATFVVPFFKTLLEFILVITAFGTIRLYGRVDFVIYLFFPCLFLIVFAEMGFGVTVMARVHDVSNGIQENYQLMKLKAAADSRKYLDSCLKACRPLRCQLTSALFIEKSTRLVILDMILGWTVYLLLAFPAD